MAKGEATAGRSGGSGGGGTSVRRRRVSSSGGGGGTPSGSNMLRFYTDEDPGLKISPTMVLIMSVCFIAFVTALHVAAKLSALA